MKRPKFIPEFEDIPSPRTKMNDLPVAERAGTFVEVEKGFTEEQALREAARCLSCRRCIGCGLCLAECDSKAIVYDEGPKTVTLEVDTVILAPGLEPFDAGRKRNLGYRNAANVITSLELERLLSPTGPFSGRVLRPYDGKVPRRIAIVQCVGCREEAIGANYCSTFCCTNAVKQASALRRHIPKSEVTIFHRTLRPWGPGSEADLLAAARDERLRFVEAEVSEVKPVPETGDLLLAFTAGGEKKTGTFDLVVLSVALSVHRSAKDLGRKAKVKTDKYGFCATAPFAPVETSAPGVLAAGAFTGPAGIGECVTQATAAAARVLGKLAGAETGTSSPAVEPHGKRGVLLCRYGLRSHGIADTGEIRQDLSHLDRIAWVGEDEFACRALRRKDLRRELEDRGVGTLAATCYGASHRELFEHAFQDKEKKPAVRLLDLSRDPGTAGGLAGRIAALFDAAADAPPAREATRRVALVGAGPEGVSAALHLAARGIPVDLIAAEGDLGGRLRRVPVPDGSETSAEEGAESLVRALRENERIRIHDGARVTAIEGGPGAFTLATSGGAGIEAGAVILAPGAADYDPKDLRGGSVITQAELEDRLASGGLDARRVVMVQCVGSRTEDYPVCSLTCCAQAIRNARAIRAARADAAVTILHRDIRVYGLDEDLYTDAVEEGVSFVRILGDPSIAAGRVDFTTFSGALDSLEVDLVVLSTGIRPVEGFEEMARAAGLTTDPQGFLVPLDRSFHPVESHRPGIFVCGLATGPKPLGDCIAGGAAAGARAAAFLKTRPR